MKRKNNDFTKIIKVNKGNKLPDVIESTKEKKERIKRVEQFRNSNKSRGHLSYVYEKNGEQLSYLSMTHTPPEETKENYIQLTRSVDPNDANDAYINTVADNDHYLNFGPKKKNYSFAPEDEKKVRKIIKANKKARTNSRFGVD